MQGKPISQGCLALITHAVHPENKGRVVRVVALHMAESPTNVRIWTIQFPGIARVNRVGRTTLSDYAHHPECWLKRIDGDNDQLFGEDDEVGLNDKQWADMERILDKEHV